MPSHTAASAFIKLYFLDGAPWNWQAWQERTGIRHGLFPSDDAKLPSGLTRQKADDIEAYFRAYNQLDTEEKKINFATKTKGNAAYPGRAIWNTFVSKNWNRWGIHGLTVAELKDWDIHPQDIVTRENAKAWPSADSYIPMILDSLGMKLFGEEAFPDGVDRLSSDLRACLKILVQRSWNNIRVQISNLKNRAGALESAARDAFKGEGHLYVVPVHSSDRLVELEEGKPTKVKVNKTIRAVAKWKECAEIFSTADNIRTAEEMLTELQAIMEGLGAKIKSKKPIAPKGLWIPQNRFESC